MIVEETYEERKKTVMLEIRAPQDRKGVGESGSKAKSWGTPSPHGRCGGIVFVVVKGLKILRC